MNRQSSLRLITITVTWVLVIAMVQATSFGADSKPRRALEFDGKNDSLTAKLEATLDGDLTLEAWISSTAIPSVQERILGLCGPEGCLQVCTNGGHFVIDNAGGPVKGIVGPGGANDGVWHHVVIKRYEKTTYALHVDGVSVGDCEGMTPTYNSISIGVAPGYPHFAGFVDEVRLYDRCLTDMEVLDNYQGTKPVVTHGLIGWWKLDGDMNDSVGSSHCQTMGAPKWVAGRGTALFDRPRIRCRFYPAPGKVSVWVDSRQMGSFPPDARWEVVLQSKGGTTLAKQVTPVTASLKGEVSLQVDKSVPGECEVQVRVVDARSKPIGETTVGKVALTERPAWTQRVKVLNNLVMELLHVKERLSGAQKTCTFLNPREGWVFLSATAATDLKETDRAEVLLGTKALIACESGKERTQETMRYLPAGEYRLSVLCKGKGALSSLIARTMPEIIYCEFGDNPKVKELGPFDLNFLSRIGLLRNINTIEGDANFENKADPYHEEWQRQGKRWISERTIGNEKTPEAQYEFWMYPLTTTQPFTDGLLIDEFMSFTPFRNEAVSKMLADPRMKDKLFYPYVCSPHPNRGGDEAIKFMRLVMDSGNRVAWERYLQEQHDEKDAENYLDMCILQDLEKLWLPSLPDAVSHTIMCFGNYLSAPPSNLNADPSVDFKVWMDMQYNLMAKDPRFFGLYGLMEWSSGYADEEVVRWAARLYRHYGIEGKTELLSPTYGFRYRLTHIMNPDFGEGLKGWDLKPAEEASLAARKFVGYSSLQGRYPETSQGDKFAWMKKNDQRPNILSQEIRNLTPGKLYSVKMISGDYRDLTDGKSAEKKHVVGITINGVDLVPSKCFQSIMPGNHWLTAGSFSPKNLYWINFHRRVFRARSSTARLTISDWVSEKEPGGPAGQELAINFIEVQPYLEE